MSQFLRKTLHFRASSQVCLQNPNLSSLRLRRFSVSSEDNHSFTVSYLINSLGFSPENALSASKYLSFKTGEKPDKTIQFLINSGFSKTQISKMVRVAPQTLSLTEKTIMPKLEFLKSIGISGDEIAKMVSSHPLLLKTSLSNQIVPSYDYLRNFIRSDKKTVAAVKRFPSILGCHFKILVSNAGFLRDRGVPDLKIATLMSYQPRALVFCLHRFRKVVEEVAEMGFDASRLSFVTAVRVCMSLSRSTWQRKVETYKKCGFSEEEVLKAFRSEPLFMSHSEGKILAVMEFFANEMGWSPSLIVSYPSVIGLSLEGRVIPRFWVFKALLSKGLVKNQVCPAVLLKTSEERFLAKYVKPYEKEAPELLELYKEKLGLRNESVR